MKPNCTFEEIKQVGGNGMFLATLNLTGHSACISVIGKDLDECIVRAMAVREAFNQPKQVKP